MDSATWAALALTLTLLGGVLSFLAWRRRGVAAGLRGLSWTLVPIAAWLTGTLRLAVDVGQAVTDWAARLVFSPTVWLGLAVGGVAVGLWFLSGAMLSRGKGVNAARRDEVAAPSSGRQELPPSRKKSARDDDLDDMADIEAILKKHGI